MTNGSYCDICVQIVGSARLAGPRRHAARTDSDPLYFLETVTFNPTWMRPLFENISSLHLHVFAIDLIRVDLVQLAARPLLPLTVAHAPKKAGVPAMGHASGDRSVTPRRDSRDWQ